MHDLESTKILSAIVLSGGQSRRMQGVDKGLIKLGGKPMISYVLESLSQHMSEISISTNSKEAAYQQLGYPLVVDELVGNIGPLAGIHAGLSITTTERLLVVPCDTPFLDIKLAQRLINAMEQDNARIAVAHDGERLQTTFAVIETSKRDSLTVYLKRGGRRLITWYKEEGAVEVDCSDVKESFFNVNTMGDIEVAEEESKFRGK
ncbi:MAG: hypothetical protein A6F71_10295 [Cycloclasticus sp. symbiont of Poecilosclerida sp. M]|nr:MAG: hypothetical protein A6F71_10295 [Cycloclasticus sp. symbiont of Poecilosclerida sp. M]